MVQALINYEAVPQIFHDAQTSTLHSTRKLAMALDRNMRQLPITSFISKFLHCLNRVLIVKKSDQNADRIFKMIAAFLHLLNRRCEEQGIVETNVTNGRGMIEGTDPLATQFVETFMKHLLSGIDSKDKIVRFRVCQLLAMTISFLGEIDEETYLHILSALRRRLRDRESSIRVQATTALARLQGDEDEAREITDLLVHVLQHDPSAEVRRTALYNLEQIEETLPFLLERARDTDATNRRAVYSKIMQDIQGFRPLSIGKREKLLRWGLKDRDANVRAAAAKMFALSWIEHANHNLLELLERLDVVNSRIASEAMQQFYELRPDVVHALNFDAMFWQTLTPESIFLIRTLNDFHRSRGEDETIGEKLPEISQFTEYIQSQVDSLSDDEEPGARDDTEFIIEQMLLIADKLDFADEIGRGRLFALARNIMMDSKMPDCIIDRAVHLMGQLVISEQEFAQVVSEIVTDIHDALDEDADHTNPEESFHSASSNVLASPRDLHNLKQEVVLGARKEPSMPEIMANLRCLGIVKAMLELLEKDLSSHIHLRHLLNDFIVPCVRSHEAPVRERGLRCLGLCCLLDKVLATENIVLFVHCFARGHDELKTEALRIICDILMCHGPHIFSGDSAATINNLFKKAMATEAGPEVQACSTLCAAKLLLTGIVGPNAFLPEMVLLYYDPATADNISLRQALSYFFPVFSYSKAANQTALAEIAVALLSQLVARFEEQNAAQTLQTMTMTTPILMAAQLLDWCDPRKLVLSGPEQLDIQSSQVHFAIARNICERLHESSSSDKERKVLCSMLGKLYIPANCATNSDFVTLIAELDQLVEDKIVVDAVSKNAIARLKANLDKLLTDEKAVPQLDDAATSEDSS